jgi:dimethylargininase
VVDELAVMTRPLLPARQAEVASVAVELERFRPVAWVSGEATLEGGDVLRIGRRVYVGLSARTNAAGVEQLASFLEPHGYRVQAVSFGGCLHLKSACTGIGRDSLLANREWVDPDQFAGCGVVDVDPSEPAAGNALLVGDAVVLPANFPQTARRLREQGFRVEAVDVSELQKAEAGVTCCSILLTEDASNS